MGSGPILVGAYTIKSPGMGLLMVEAATGFEPVIKVLQTSALPLGHAAR
jgi:hypothetical protein